MPIDAPESAARPAEDAATPRDGAARAARSRDIRSTKPRQVRPKTEGWQQQKGADGRPLLQFASPKRGKPPVHMVDLTPEQRVEKVKELGLPGFRAKQLEKHYFQHWTHDPADMTDLPAAGREEFVHGMLPALLTEVRRLETDRGDTIKFLWKLHDGALVESVLMRYPGRITLCVSSQAGCAMACCLLAACTGRWSTARASGQQPALPVAAQRARGIRDGMEIANKACGTRVPELRRRAIPGCRAARCRRSRRRPATCWRRGR